jgi:uncharacterized protein (DUF427 family)
VAASNSAPGYKKYPNHRIVTNTTAARVRVSFSGQVIADTRDAVVLEENGYSPVYYLPRADGRMDALVRSSHRTHCPFKGDASYFSLKDGPENAVWSYETPYNETMAIKDRLAFYRDKVSIDVVRE